MRKVSINSLKGGEIIGNEVCTAGGISLIPAGTILKPEYITKLKELSIKYVYVKSKNDEQSNLNITEEYIQKQCAEVVQNIIERYSCYASNELKEITIAAESIIQEVLKKPQVMYKVAYIREQSGEIYLHCVNVCAMSILIGLKLKLTKERLRQLAIGALLHDIGLVYLPEKLKKSKFEKCTEQDQLLIYGHVIEGYSIVENETWLSTTAKDIILSHHERLNGEGYPMHLKQNKLKTEVKIVSLCDYFDYSLYGFFIEKQNIKDIIDFMMSEAGRSFDFDIVNEFIATIIVYQNGTEVILSTGERARVVRQNYKMPLRPVVQIVHTDGKGIQQLDLVKELSIIIEDIVE